MIKRITTILIVSITVIALSASCTVERKIVGDYDTSKRSVIYERSHDFYFFWEMVQTRNAEDFVTIKNYEKVTKRTPFDVVMYYGTLGLLSPYTVEFRVMKDSEEAKDRPYKRKVKEVEDSEPEVTLP